jgi:hypothetical protein
MKSHSVILTNMQRRDVNTKNITDGGVTSYSIKYLGDDIAHLFHEMEAYPQTHLHNIKNNHLLHVYQMPYFLVKKCKMNLVKNNLQKFSQLMK